MIESVRDLIRLVGEEARKPDLQPKQATDLLLSLTGLYGNMLDEARETDIDYNAVLVKHMANEEAANRARILAKASPEYAKAKAAKDGVQECMQLINSLKAFIKAKGDEARLG